MINYFNFVWIIGCCFYGLGSILFWRLFYAVTVRLGMRDSEDNAWVFFFCFVVNVLIAVVAALAPFNNWYQ